MLNIYAPIAIFNIHITVTPCFACFIYSSTLSFFYAEGYAFLRYYARLRHAIDITDSLHFSDARYDDGDMSRLPCCHICSHASSLILFSF